MLMFLSSISGLIILVNHSETLFELLAKCG